LKKVKLQLKDQMESIVRRHTVGGAPHAAHNVGSRRARRGWSCSSLLRKGQGTVRSAARSWPS
jgi:hypothetical protein